MTQFNMYAMQKALSLVRAGNLADATSIIQASLTQKSQESLEPRATAAYQLSNHPNASDIVVAQTTPSSVIEANGSTKLGALTYRLFIPQTESNAKPSPLIVMLHGCKQNAHDFAVGTQMDQIGGRAGCFVVYPQQSSYANASGCWNWFKHTHQLRERGEPKALAMLILNLLQTYNIDSSRVYIAGLSAGGAMAAIMGEQYPELFAGVGVHSGLPTGVARNLPEAMLSMQGHGNKPNNKPPVLPMIVFHGDSDKTVAPANGQHFANDIGLHPDSIVETTRGAAGRQFTKNIYRHTNGAILGEYWEIEGAGHAWSGGNKSGSYTDAIGPDASNEMIRFFLSIKNR